MVGGRGPDVEDGPHAVCAGAAALLLEPAVAGPGPQARHVGALARREEAAGPADEAAPVARRRREAARPQHLPPRGRVRREEGRAMLGGPLLAGPARLATCWGVPGGEWAATPHRAAASGIGHRDGRE